MALSLGWKLLFVLCQIMFVKCDLYECEDFEYVDSCGHNLLTEQWISHVTYDLYEVVSHSIDFLQYALFLNGSMPIEASYQLNNVRIPIDSRVICVQYEVMASDNCVNQYPNVCDTNVTILDGEERLVEQDKLLYSDDYWMVRLFQFDLDHLQQKTNLKVVLNGNIRQISGSDQHFDNEDFVTTPYQAVRGIQVYEGYCAHRIGPHSKFKKGSFR